MAPVASGGSAGAAVCGDEFTGPSKGKWNVAENWEHGLPTSSTIVCWAAEKTVVAEGVDTADSILIGGTLDTNGAEITLANGADQSTIKNLKIEGGRLNGPGSLALTGNFLWTGSGPAGFSTSAAMALTQTGGGSFVIEGEGQAYMEGGSISTTSPVTIDDNYLIGASFNGTPKISTTSTMTFASGEYKGAGAGLTLEAAGFITTAATNVPDFNLVLTGSASSLGGSLTAGAFSSHASSSLTVPLGVTLAPDKGTISGTVTGAGTYRQEGFTSTVASGGTLSTADVEVPVGILSIEKGATYDATSATTVKIGGQMEIGDSGKTGDLTLSGPSASTLGGGPSGGSLAVTGNFLWTGGTSELSHPNPLEITQSGGGEFKIEGTGQAYLLGGSITTSSPISITNPEFITAGKATITTTGVLSFGEGLVVPENGGDQATFTAASVAPNSGSSYGLNADALVLTGPATTTVEAGHELQSGPLSVKGGTLADNGTVKSEVKVQGGTLSGSGTVLGAVKLETGTVKPAMLPGKLTVDGVYQQQPGGTLDVEVESESAYSQLLDKEAPQLESTTVDVTDKNGFEPAAGQKFDVISTLHNPTGGGFTTIGGPSGSLYNAVYGETFAALEGKETPPVNTALPQITGTPRAGEKLTCSTGSWSPAAEHYAYQWNLDGSPIIAATGSEFVIQTSDQGHTLTCSVIASDEAGDSVPATSAGVLIPVPVTVPVNSAPPTITGTAAVGAALGCSTGTWSGGPTGYSFRWYRGGVPIAGANGSAYMPVPADGGQTLTCAVSASSSAGASAFVASGGVEVPVPAPLLLSCSGKDIELVSVSVKGRSVLLAGIALKQFAGQRVTITLSDVSRRVAKGKGGATTVGADGTFHLRLALPKGRTAPLTRYTATVAGHASLGLKLGRVLLITAEHASAGGLQVSFKGTGALARGQHTIEIVRQVSCTSSVVFESKKLGPGAALTVTLPAPTETGAVAYYRAQTPTSAGPTYSLPIAVKQGA